MKQKMFFAALLLCAASSVCAQTESYADSTEVRTSNEEARKNWFVSASAGPQVLLSDHDKLINMGRRISPALDIAVGKWFKPWVGARLMYSGLSVKGATQNGAHTTGEDIKEKPQAGYWLEYQKFNMYHVHADALFDLTNVFDEYNPERFYNCIVYAGIGVVGTGEEPTSTNFAGNAGVLNTFRLDQNWGLNLDIRGVLVGDSFDGEEGGRSEGILNLTIGVTYTFN